MLFFYAVALLFFALGGVAAARSSGKITWWEWMIGGSAAFITAVIFHLTAFRMMTADVETLSGSVTEVRHVPRWVEEYRYCTTHRVGKVTVTTWHTGYETHNEHWVASDTFDRSLSLTQDRFDLLVKTFGSKTMRVQGQRSTMRMSSHMIAGDPLDDIALPGPFVWPVTMLHTWTNRVKACPSVWSFPQPPEKAELYDYPAPDDPWHSGRLINQANIVDPFAWDQMNARIGQMKQVNVIMVGFGNKASPIAQQQRAKWIGGKKNDLVVCYGGPTSTQADWVEVFGWTESELCKQDLRSIVLSNRIDAKLIPLIEAEIVKNYEIKDWTKFDYLTIEPPMWSYWVFFAVIIITQFGAYLWFYHNEHESD